MQTTETRDRYGNRVKIEIYDDGRCKRITFPEAMYDKFEFLGDEYSVSDLWCNNETLKEYYKDSRSEAILQRDRYGRLFLFFYDEYWLSNGDDRYDYIWAVVADEADSDSLVQVYRLSRLREPYISYDGDRFQAAHEWIKHEKINNL
jgi:hypothetical protein